jgi:hypothetical protein
MRYGKICKPFKKGKTDMNEAQKIFVSIYCKIFTDTFSDEMIDKMATGKEIYQFLMKDARNCFDDNGHIIPKDLNLYYLGCNQKFGYLIVENKVWNWSFGESSFDNVEAFVKEIYNMRIFTDQQFRALMGKIAEGRMINNMYLIKDYLICKREGISWTKKPDAGKFRNDIKRMVGDVEKSFRGRAYQFYHS